MTTITISADKSAYPRPKKDPFATYTPKNLHIGIFEKTPPKDTLERSSYSQNKNTIMTIDTWRE